MSLFELDEKLKRRLRRIKKIELLFGLDNSKSEEIKSIRSHVKLIINSKYGLEN